LSISLFGISKKKSVCMSEMTTWWAHRKSLRQKSTLRSRFTLGTRSLSNMSVPAVLNWSSNFKRPRTVPAINVTNTGYRHWLTSCTRPWRRNSFDTTTFLRSKHTFFPVTRISDGKSIPIDNFETVMHFVAELRRYRNIVN
jgi:hypothetical protein